MGKPKIRLNPKVDSIRNRVLHERAIKLLLSIVMLLPEAKTQTGKGRRRYDYRIILILSILRILLNKRYADYEVEMRSDQRILNALGVSALPCKSTIHNYDLKVFTMSLLTKVNKNLVDAWIKKPVDLALDASGIRIIGRSIWYSIRTKRKGTKKECDKVHIGVSLCSLIITNFAISNGKRNDSPFLRKMLYQYNKLGIVLADKGYSSKINALFVSKKGGAFFSPFKSNVVANGMNTWAYMKKLWNVFPFICKNIYNRRNVVEAIFSALKKRYGDNLHSKKWFMRRREMFLRFVAYNIRIIIGIQIARELQIPLWVKYKEKIE